MVTSVNANGAFPLTRAQGQRCIVKVKFLSNRAWMEARLGHAAKKAKQLRQFRRYSLLVRSEGDRGSTGTAAPGSAAGARSGGRARRLAASEKPAAAPVGKYIPALAHWHRRAYRRLWSAPPSALCRGGRRSANRFPGRAPLCEPPKPETVKLEAARIEPAKTEDQAIAEELGLSPDLAIVDLQRLRRDFAKKNHPDRFEPARRTNAARRMSIANMLIDEQMRQNRSPR